MIEMIDSRKGLGMSNRSCDTLDLDRVRFIIFCCEARGEASDNIFLRHLDAIARLGGWMFVCEMRLLQNFGVVFVDQVATTWRRSLTKDRD